MLRLQPDFYQNLSIWKRLFLKPFSGGITSCRNLGLTQRTIIGGVRIVVSAKRGSLLLAGSCRLRTLSLLLTKRALAAPEYMVPPHLSHCIAQYSSFSLNIGNTHFLILALLQCKKQGYAPPERANSGRKGESPIVKYTTPDMTTPRLYTAY